jgi:hypothetical protein
MKKTLLIAVAALAAGVISTQAQVYSQNIVGYANVVNSSPGANYFQTVPFLIGSSNGLNEVFAGGLPPGSTVNLWNGSGFTAYVYDNSDPIGDGTSVVWYDAQEDAAITQFPSLNPGQGFLLVPNGSWTNTFAGAIALSVGTSNKMVLSSPGANYFVAPVVPYAGSVTNGNSSTGGANLNNLPPGSTVNIWNGSGFTAYVYDNSDPIGDGTSVVWYDAQEDAAIAPPTISVGQSFLLVPNGSYTWTTGL